MLPTARHDMPCRSAAVRLLDTTVSGTTSSSNAGVKSSHAEPTNHRRTTRRAIKAVGVAKQVAGRVTSIDVSLPALAAGLV